MTKQKPYQHLFLSNVLKKRRSGSFQLCFQSVGAKCCVLLHFSQRGEDEGAEPRAANCDARREGALLLEVDGDADDGGEVDQAEPDNENDDNQDKEVKVNSQTKKRKG